MLNGERGAQGPLALRRPRRRADRLAAAHLRRRPHRPPLARRRGLRRRGPGPPSQRARGRRRAPGLPAQHATPVAGPALRPPAPPAEGSPSTPGVGAQALAVAPGAGHPRGARSRGVDHGVLVTSMAGLHSGVNPVSGDFSVGVEGLMVQRRRAGRAHPRGHHRLHGPAPAARHRSRRRRPRVAAGRHGRRHPRHPRRRPLGQLTRRSPLACRSSTPSSSASPRASRSSCPSPRAGTCASCRGCSSWDDFAGRESLEKTFDVALHLGTLVGAIAYFRADIVRLRARRVPARRAVGTHDGKLAWLIALSTVPAAVTGALLADAIEERTGHIWLIATMLIVFGLVLGVGRPAPGHAHGGGGRRARRRPHGRRPGRRAAAGRVPLGRDDDGRSLRRASAATAPPGSRSS